MGSHNLIPKELRLLVVISISGHVPPIPPLAIRFTVSSLGAFGSLLCPRPLRGNHAIYYAESLQGFTTTRRVLRLSYLERTLRPFYPRLYELLIADGYECL